MAGCVRSAQRHLRDRSFTGSPDQLYYGSGNFDSVRTYRVAWLFPFLPSSALPIPSGGVVVDFENPSLPFAASNELNADAHALSSTSWVNWGEEFDPADGVRISQDGDTWYSLTPGGWGSLHPIVRGEWYSVRDVALTGATPVNTDLDFYLAFAAQDDSPFGAKDGVAIDDIRIHRPDQLTLTLSNLKSGATAQLHHSGGTPGNLGCISYSVTGGGPIPTAFGTFYITPPWVQIPCVLLDASGSHTRLQAVPPGLAGTPIWFQTLEWPGFELSNGVGLLIK